MRWRVLLWDLAGLAGTRFCNPVARYGILEDAHVLVDMLRVLSLCGCIFLSLFLIFLILEESSSLHSKLYVSFQ